MRGKRERTKTVKYIWSGLLFLAVSGILTLIAKNQSVIFGMVFYLYLQRPGVCDRAVVWESSIFVCGAESLCCDFFDDWNWNPCSFRVQEGRKKSNLAMACGIVFGRLYYAACICDQLRHQLS